MCWYAYCRYTWKGLVGPMWGLIRFAARMADLTLVTSKVMKVRHDAMYFSTYRSTAASHPPGLVALVELRSLLHWEKPAHIQGTRALHDAQQICPQQTCTP